MKLDQLREVSTTQRDEVYRDERQATGVQIIRGLSIPILALARSKCQAA